MKRARRLQFISTVFLVVVTGSALAATATIRTEVNTLSDPTGQSTQFACSTSPNCDTERVTDAPLLVSDPDGVSAAASLNYAHFAPENVSDVPNFVHTGSAQAKAMPGSLHASAEVYVDGTGGGSFRFSGTSAVAYVAVSDQIKVNSSVLPNGTLVTLNAALNITGQGRGRLGLEVRGRKAGIGAFALLFGEEDIAEQNSDSLLDIAGQFTAEVGSTLNIDYFLQANTAVSSAGWAAIDRLNGRASGSYYGNSAYLYFSAADPTTVSLQGLSGYQYVQPNPVPLPAAFWLLLPGIAALASCRRESA